MDKKNARILLIMHILIVFWEIIGFIPIIKEYSWGLFQYYTQDSNLLLLIASIIFIVYLLKHFNDEKITIPKWLQVLKYTATVCVTLTFIVVVTILAWTVPGGLKHMMFDGAMLYLHTLCPIMAMISFIFFEKCEITKKINLIRTSYFTLAYTIIIILLNILKVIEGPYPFLLVYNQSVFVSIFWFISIALEVGLIMYILKQLNHRFSIGNK